MRWNQKAFDTKILVPSIHIKFKVTISVYSNWQTAFFLFTHQLDIEWHLHKQPYYRLLNKVQTPISFEFWFVLVCQLMMGIQCIYLKLIVENSCQQLQSGCRDWQDWTETVTMCQSNLQENTAEPGDHSQKPLFHCWYKTQVTISTIYIQTLWINAFNLFPWLKTSVVMWAHNCSLWHTVSL